MARGSRALQRCYIAVAGQYRVEKYQKNVTGWISGHGGSSQSQIDNRTTHVMASEKAWRRKDPLVAKALELNRDEGRDIKIVSFDWLEDSVNNKTKKKEGPYLWEKLDASLQKRDAAQKRADKANEPKEQKSHVGMLKEVFDESTEKFVSDKERKRVDRQIEEEVRARKAIEEEEKKERAEERKKKAEVFGRGAKKARNEIFTGEYFATCHDVQDILMC